MFHHIADVCIRSLQMLIALALSYLSASLSVCKLFQSVCILQVWSLSENVTIAWQIGRKVQLGVKWGTSRCCKGNTGLAAVATFYGKASNLDKSGVERRSENRLGESKNSAKSHGICLVRENWYFPSSY